MPDTGFKIAGTGSDDASVGTLSWSNVLDIQFDDGTNAFVEFVTPNNTHYLRASNFGFSADIPAGSVIVGIEVRTQRDRNLIGPEVNDTHIRLFDASGSPAGDNKSTGLDWGDVIEGVFTFGGPTDLWGLSLTRDDVINTNFGWGQACETSGSDTAVDCDVMEMKVYYTVIEYEQVSFRFRNDDGVLTEPP